MERTGLSLFAVCAPGLEPLVEAELRGLGIAGVAEPGGVAFDGGAVELSRANLELRTATRVLRRLGTFRARTFGELERHARAVWWANVLTAGAEVRLRVSCSKSRLYHEGAVAERMYDAIGERTGARPAARAVTDDDDSADAQLIVVRFHRDVCTVSADTSGAPLHMRGYRQALAKAPLRETLAAAMLLGSRWPADVMLLDPLCGSGTIAIEAALLARRVPPALAGPDRRPRDFRFRAWPDHDSAVFDREVVRLRAAILDTALVPVLASDRNAGAIRAATSNAERAGVASDVGFEIRDLDAVRPPSGTGWLVTNPPYGVRVGDRAESRAVAALLARLGRTTFSRWTLVALTADAGLGRRLEGSSEALRTRNGGIPVHLLVRPPGAETGAGAGA